MVLEKDGKETDLVRTEEVLVNRVKEQRNILPKIQRRKTNWIGHIWCRKFLQNHVTEGKIEGMIEVTVRRGRRCNQVPDDIKENR